VEEAAASTLKDVRDTSHKRIAVPAHGLETGGLDKPGPDLGRDRDCEELGNPPHLPRQVRLQVIIVDEEDVRAVPLLPPGLSEVEERGG
jgi:hypothetical protein